jgi:hypothetical protein
MIGFVLGKIVGYILAAPYVALFVVIFIGLSGGLVSHWILGRPPDYWLGPVIAAGATISLFIWGAMERHHRERQKQDRSS